MSHSALRTILVVEEDEANRSLLTPLLERSGYTVQVAQHGQEALAQLRAGLRPVLILLDLKRPILSGPEFRQQQSLDPAVVGVPVVILSDLAETVGEWDGLGDIGYLQKPFEAEALLTVIDRFVGPSKPEVLVVEDEPGVLKMLDMALRHSGFTVLLARGGEQALQLYQERAGSIAAVLMDVQMPGMDGPQTLAALRELDPNVRCCFMSGHTGRYSAEELLAGGALCVLAKPFPSLAHLSRTLWGVVRPPAGA